MSAHLTCDCGQCFKCRKRTYMHEYYWRNREKLCNNERRYRKRRTVAQRAEQERLRVERQCAGQSRAGKFNWKKRRCLRTGRFECHGQWFCRTHRPQVPKLEEDVYPDTILLCACGCGVQLNPWHALFRTLKRDGWTGKAIADRYEFDRTYVNTILRQPPRYIQGHYRNTVGGEAINNPERSLFYDRPHAGERIISLDAVIAIDEPGAPLSLGEITGRVESDTAIVWEQEERSRAIWAIVGDLKPDDVLRMDESQLAALQKRLLSEGIGPSGIQQSERERLREPITHSGAGIQKAHGYTSKRKRVDNVRRTAIKKAKGRSRRPAQKPRKRWEREAA